MSSVLDIEIEIYMCERNPNLWIAVDRHSQCYVKNVKSAPRLLSKKYYSLQNQTKDSNA